VHAQDAVFILETHLRQGMQHTEIFPVLTKHWWDLLGGSYCSRTQLNPCVVIFRWIRKCLRPSWPCSD